MGKSFIEEFFKSFSNYYFASALWFVCGVLALLIVLKNHKNNKGYTLFIVYIIASIIISGPCNFLIRHVFNIVGKESIIYTEVMNTIFTLFELLAIFYLIKNQLKIKQLSLVLIYIQYVFISFCVIFFWYVAKNKLSTSETSIYSYTINIIEFLILIPLCLVYFYKLITQQVIEIDDIKNNPAFWIIIPFFIYCTVSLPFLLIGNKIDFFGITITNILMFAHLSTLSFVMLGIAKAFTCKTTKTI